MNFGANPVHRERHQAHVEVGIEALHGLHESHVALLDEVADRQAVAGIAFRDVHHEAQVRHDQFTGSLEVPLFAETAGQRLLVFLAEDGNVADCLDIRTEVAHGAGQIQIVHRCRDCCAHGFRYLPSDR